MMNKKDLLTLKKWSGEDLIDIIDKAIAIKKSPGKYVNLLERQTLAMLFQKTSTRTRVSFEVAMAQLGGHAIYLDWRTTNFTLAEIEDEIRYLSRNVDIIMARLFKHIDLEKTARASRVPVINGCTEKYHPCQALCDLMTIKEKRGRLEGLKLVYVGVQNNVCNSLINGCIRVGMKITVVTPIIHEPSVDKELMKEAEKSGLYQATLDIEKAIDEADIVYTDTWVDMELFLDPKFKKEKEMRIKKLKPYQLNESLLRGKDVLVMHDMPIHEGYEITRAVIESSHSIIFDQAENRLYGEKAILLRLLGRI
jgi:ornithine carbamoyltransferase